MKYKNTVQKKAEGEKEKYMTEKCHLCNGTGLMPKRRSKYSKELRQEARKMYQEGKTLREIGRKFAINHPQKVYSMIMAKTL